MLLDPKLSILFDLAEAGVGESAASVGGVPRVWVGRPKCKAPAGFPSIVEAGVSMRGLPDCLESEGWCFLVVEVGAGATPRHNGAGYD